MLFGMSMLALYARLMRALGPERRLAVGLALANLLLAAAQFGEPILFGRVIDALVRPRDAAHPLTFGLLMPVVLAWVGFGLVSLAGGVAVSYNADLLSHRARLSALSRYFSHVLSLPLAFHLGTHSGRVMKVMSSGSDAMWMLWLGINA